MKFNSKANILVESGKVYTSGCKKEGGKEQVGILLAVQLIKPMFGHVNGHTAVVTAGFEEDWQKGLRD